MNTKYRYPKSISTPEARKVYRHLKRHSKMHKNIADAYYSWFDAERKAHDELKAKLKELAG